MSYPYDRPGMVEQKRYGLIAAVIAAGVVARWWIGVVWIGVRVSGWLT